MFQTVDTTHFTIHISQAFPHQRTIRIVIITSMVDIQITTKPIMVGIMVTPDIIQGEKFQRVPRTGSTFL
tara:strand:+ start:546 stop:755 length:210 start_codon:yes stop_codon:yes gene_type:complete